MKGLDAQLPVIIYSLVVLSYPLICAYIHLYTPDHISNIFHIAVAPAVSPVAFGTRSATVEAVAIGYSVEGTQEKLVGAFITLKE